MFIRTNMAKKEITKNKKATKINNVDSDKAHLLNEFKKIIAFLKKYMKKNNIPEGELTQEMCFEIITKKGMTISDEETDSLFLALEYAGILSVEMDSDDTISEEEAIGELRNGESIKKKYTQKDLKENNVVAADELIR